MADFVPSNGTMSQVNSGSQNFGETKSSEELDLVRACQYGVLERVVELVDTLGSDVNAKDPEGITPLHWASINNRRDVMNFLITRGAEVDAVGGELRSTPCHWATRYLAFPRSCSKRLMELLCQN
jgi:ankyrin repeat protein